MSDDTNRSVGRNVSFGHLKSHLRDHVGLASLIIAVILLVGGTAMLRWFFDGTDYNDLRALKLLYGFTFLLGLVTIWSLVHTMLVAFAERQIRLMNAVGIPDASPPAPLIVEIGKLSVTQAKALSDEEVARLERLSDILAGNRVVTTQDRAAGDNGATLVLRGFLDAAMKLPDARFFFVSFLVLLIIALALDPNYDLPSVTVDITAPGTPTPTETAVVEATAAPTEPAIASPEVGAGAHMGPA